MFIFTSLYTLLPLPSTTILLHTTTSFYHVLNNTSQALVAVSSSGHIRIAPHAYTSC
jgi:hypothetical protein